MAAGLTVNEDKLEAAMERLSELLDKQGAWSRSPCPPRRLACAKDQFCQTGW